MSPAQTLLTIGADTKYLGARLGVTFVLHTWGSAMTHHTHVHGIVPGGGLSLDGEQWISCKSGFFLPVRVLSRLFRRLYLEMLREAFEHHRLLFFGEFKPLEEEAPFRHQPCEYEWLISLVYWLVSKNLNKVRLRIKCLCLLMFRERA